MNSGRVTFEHKARLKQILTCVSWENTTHPHVHHTHTYTHTYIYFFILLVGTVTQCRGR